MDVLNRRDALRALAGFLAGSPLLRAQQDPFRDHSRVPGIKELLNVFDFEAVTFAKQPRAAYDYRAYGADSEFTLRRNREAYDWVELVPRRVAGSGVPQTATELFGTKMAYPLMVSPTAFQVQLHADAELATHKGAAAASGTPMIVSNNSSFTFDKIAAASPSPLWVQLYPKQQMDLNQQYIEAAQAAGARALVVTVDQQASVYERALHDRNLGGTPLRRTSLAGVPDNPYRIPNNRMWYEWKFFDDLRRFTKIPIMAKGIVTAEDARLCVERGLDAVYVSNHGGRSLDYGPSTLEVLRRLSMP